MGERVTLYAVGDIGIHRDLPGQDPKSALVHVAETLRQADIGFCQLERILSTRGTAADDARSHSRVSPNMVSALTFAGFDVVSFASNHSLDWGHEAFLDTIGVLQRHGLAVIGAGKNTTEARTPAILECKGTRVAFLGYCSILQPGYAATKETPGVAPMAAFTIYQPLEYQPGTPGCRVLTFPNPDDIEAMEEDIRKVRPLADVVVVSHHWGIHFQPATIAMYQRRVAHAAINAGADLVLGHHAHILKGVEVYKGKVIFYSLGNFALDDSYDMVVKWLRKPGLKEWMESYDWKPDPDYPGYGMPVASRKTMIAKCLIGGGKIDRVSFLPTYINKNAEPELLHPGDKKFRDTVEYMKEITVSQGLNANYAVEGNEVVIS